jgi:hypothetical protein
MQEGGKIIGMLFLNVGKRKVARSKPEGYLSNHIYYYVTFREGLFEG